MTNSTKPEKLTAGPAKKAGLLVCAILLAAASSRAGDHGRPDHLVPEVWTVGRAVEFALENSPDSTMARHRIEAANAAIIEARAAFFPQVEVRSGYSQTDNPMYSFGNILNQGAFSPAIDFNEPGRTDDLNLGLWLNYRVYNGGRDRAAVEAAASREAAARMELDAVRHQLAFGVVRSFHMIVQARSVILAHEAAVEAIDASLAVAEARYAEGILLKAELLDLEVQRSSSRENLIQARNRLESANKVFLNLLGLPGGEVALAAPEEQAPGEQAPEVPPLAVPYQRIELQGAEAMIRAAEAELRQARGGRLPTVESFAAYEFDRGWETDNSGRSWQAGVQLRYRLFDGHRVAAAESRAEAMLAEARERKRRIELAVGLEVRQAELALNDAEARLEVSEKAVEQAEESARINRARFREGKILASDLINVENRRTDALLRRILAETGRRIAVADLRRAVGLKQFGEPLPETAATATMD